MEKQANIIEKPSEKEQAKKHEETILIERAINLGGNHPMGASHRQ